MSQENLEQFRRIVWQDAMLQERLLETLDAEAFLRLVVQLGQERGCHFTIEDVATALRAGQRVWIERWL